VHTHPHINKTLGEELADNTGAQLEGIEEYAALEPEYKHDGPYPDDCSGEKHVEKLSGPVIPQNWPAAGTIEFRNATDTTTTDQTF